MIENKLFEALLDVIPFRAYAVDAETYQIVYANKLMRENMHAPQQQYCWEKVFGQSEICPWCNIFSLQQRGKQRSSEKITCEFFDEYDDKWIKSYDELISWPDGREVKYSILVDISDQKEIQGSMIKSHAIMAVKNKHISKTNKALQITKLKLQKTINELEIQKSKIKPENDLKTHINGVLEAVNLLRDTKLDETQKEHLMTIERLLNALL